MMIIMVTNDDYRQCVNMAKKRPFFGLPKNINVRRWPRWEPPSSLLPALHRHDDDDDLHPHDDDDDDADILHPDDDDVDCDYGDPEEDRDDKCLMILSSQCDEDYNDLTLILPFVHFFTFYFLLCS